MKQKKKKEYTVHFWICILEVSQSTDFTPDLLCHRHHSHLSAHLKLIPSSDCPGSSPAGNGYSLERGGVGTG